MSKFIMTYIDEEEGMTIEHTHDMVFGSTHPEYSYKYLLFLRSLGFIIEDVVNVTTHREISAKDEGA